MSDSLQPHGLQHTRFSCPSHIVLPCSSKDKETACNAGDPGLIPGLGRSSAEVNGNPLQYSGLENPTDRGAWRAAVRGVTGSDRTERLTFLLLGTHNSARWETQKLILWSQLLSSLLLLSLLPHFPAPISFHLRVRAETSEEVKRNEKTANQGGR